MQQPYTVVAREMTCGEIAQGLLFAEYRDASKQYAEEQAAKR